MLRSAAFASSVVASMPTVLPFTNPASARRCSIQVKTARAFRGRSSDACARWSNDPAAPPATPARETRGAQTVRRTPGNGALSVKAFEIADQQQAEVATRRQTGATFVRVEPSAQLLDEAVEVMLVADLI